MSAASNALLALRQAEAAYTRHLNGLAVQIEAQERRLDAWPEDFSLARFDAVTLLRERRKEAATVRSMKAALYSLICSTEELCVQLEEPV